MKITGPQTVAGKTHVGPVNFLYVIMFKIVENVAKFILGPIKAQKFSRWQSSLTDYIIYHFSKNISSNWKQHLVHVLYGTILAQYNVCIPAYIMNRVWRSLAAIIRIIIYACIILGPVLIWTPSFQAYMAFIEPMHRNKPNITYLLTFQAYKDFSYKREDGCETVMSLYLEFLYF